MDDQRFDSFVKTLSTGGSRRGALQILGGGALVAVFARFAAEEDADAKKHKHKKKKCKGGTTKCGKKACCRADQTCLDGRCLDKNVENPGCLSDDDCQLNEHCENGACIAGGNGECQDAGDCAANEQCINGQCRCGFPNKPCGDACCPENQICLNGQCVIGEGTCAATDDVCTDGFGDSCNGNNDCFCGQRVDGGARCIDGFINDARDNCICIDDADCERDFAPGAICIKGGAKCQCQNGNLGRCAFLCPTQVGN
jgi:hypothetical protein